jgi:hypothetical protein
VDDDAPDLLFLFLDALHEDPVVQRSQFRSHIRDSGHLAAAPAGTAENGRAAASRSGPGRAGL